MEPPLKRPRLHIFHDTAPPDTELDTARRNNDLTLKSRFESIFEKYSHDFSNIGDEIDIFTGEVVVDNGHLQAMSSETDTSNIRGCTYDGRALLLAMAAAPLDNELENPNADQVLQSIESIAGNAITAGASCDESEDDMFNTGRSPTEDSIEVDSLGRSEEREWSTPRIEDSDTDSLFDQRSLERSESVDSLFDQASPPPSYEIPWNAQSTSHGSQTFSAPTPTEEQLLERYRPVIRQQLLEEHHEIIESRVESAWRIPVHITPPYQAAPRRSTSQNAISARNSSSVSRVMSNEPVISPQHHRSLWIAPQPRPQPRKDVISRRRDESEDPLQEGFSSEKDDSEENTPLSVADEVDEYFPPTNNAEDDDDLYGENEERKRVKEIAATGLCPYCKLSYWNRSGVMAHWDRWLMKAARHRPPNDPHDIILMDSIRSAVVRRIRHPRLVLSDFRTMVELHEGAGLSFEDIADSKVLWTRKSPSQLRDIYDKHRTLPLPGHSPPPACRWTPQEEQILSNVCRTDRVTLATMKRKLPGKDEIDIGNKLAERFLRDLGPRSVVLEHHLGNPALADNSRSREVAVKVESDDELFG